MNENVFCAPDRLGVIDFAIKREDGVLVSEISKETMEQLAVRYPGVYLSTMEEAINKQNAAMKSPAVEITEERFDEMLGCLPPMGWTRKENSESFKMSEFTCGSITGIYARIGSRYFHMSDVFTLKHEEIIASIMRAFPSLAAVPH